MTKTVRTVENDGNSSKTHGNDRDWDFCASETKTLVLPQTTPDPVDVLFWLCPSHNQLAFPVKVEMLSQMPRFPCEPKVCMDNINPTRRCTQALECPRMHLTPRAVIQLEYHFGFKFLQVAMPWRCSLEARRSLAELYKGLMHPPTVQELAQVHIDKPTHNKSMFPYSWIHRTWISDFTLAFLTASASSGNIMISDILPRTGFEQLLQMLGSRSIRTVDCLSAYLRKQQQQADTTPTKKVKKCKKPLSVWWQTLLAGAVNNNATLCPAFERTGYCPHGWKCDYFHVGTDKFQRIAHGLPLHMPSKEKPRAYCITC